MDGIQRIQEMATGQKDFVLLEIVKYLTSRTDMDNKYLNKEKNLKEMALYIQGELMKNFCKNMNTTIPASFAQDVNYNGKSVKCLAIGMSEEKIYELAINYFNKNNEELGIKSKEVKKKEVKKEKEIDNEFGSIFDVVENIKKDTKKEEIEQISLFVA